MNLEQTIRELANQSTLETLERHLPGIMTHLQAPNGQARVASLASPHPDAVAGEVHRLANDVRALQANVERNFQRLEQSHEARLDQRIPDLSGNSSNDLWTLRNEVLAELRVMDDCMERFDERLRQAESRLDKNEGKSIVLAWLFVPIIGGIVGLFFVVIQRTL
jgi:hypothetical protein